MKFISLDSRQIFRKHLCTPKIGPAATSDYSRELQSYEQTADSLGSWAVAVGDRKSCSPSCWLPVLFLLLADQNVHNKEQFVPKGSSPSLRLKGFFFFAFGRTVCWFTFKIYDI